MLQLLYHRVIQVIHHRIRCNRARKVCQVIQDLEASKAMWVRMARLGIKDVQDRRALKVERATLGIVVNLGNLDRKVNEALADGDSKVHLAIEDWTGVQVCCQALGIFWFIFFN